MNRRNLIKTLGLSAVGLATVPLWMDSWTAEALPAVGMNVSNDQQAMLAELTGVIIPKTDIPGAKELEVDKFILTMVSDCYEKDVQEDFLAGFHELEEVAKEKFGENFMELTSARQTEVAEYMLNRQAPEDQKPNFVTFVKGLTITGYLSSEYVMQNVVKYEFVPSRFNGSFPVEQDVSKRV